MGSNNANISRDIYDPRRRYVNNVVQQAISWVDADANEFMRSIYDRVRLSVIGGIGDGSPNNGFRVDGTGAVNDFTMKGGDGTFEGSGKLYAGGHCAYLFSDVTYLGTPASGLAGEDQRSIHSKITSSSYSSGPNETTIVDSSANYVTDELVGRLIYPDVEGNPGSSFSIISNTATEIVINSDQTSISVAGNRYRISLTTPSGSDRTDSVYVNLYLDEIDGDEDTNLKHDLDPPNPTVEAQIRKRLEHSVFVREDVPTHGELSSYTDGDGNFHYVIKIATLARLDADATITAGMVSDLRKVVFSGGASPPVGTINAFDGDVAPTGYLLCRGQSVLKADYPDLDAHYAGLSSPYPHGSTATEFILPDLQKKIPVGLDGAGVPDVDFDTLGETGGNKEINLEHNHGLTSGGTSTDGAHDHGGSTADANTYVGGAHGSFDSISTHDHNISSDGNHSHTLTGNTDNAGSTTENIMNPYLVVNYIIKF